MPVDNGDNFVYFMIQSEKAQTNRAIPTMGSDNTVTFFGKHGGNKKRQKPVETLVYLGITLWITPEVIHSIHRPGSGKQVFPQVYPQPVEILVCRDAKSACYGYFCGRNRREAPDFSRKSGKRPANKACGNTCLPDTVESIR